MTTFNDVETAKTSLFPFRKSGTRANPVWWNSNDVRDCTVLGYDYAIKDAQLNDVPLKSATSAATRAWINRFYQWTTVGGPVPTQAEIGYPQNLSGASNIPAVWKIDGKGNPIPHDAPPAAAPAPRTFQRKVVAAAADTAQTVLAATGTNTQDAQWVKDQFGHLGNLVKDGTMTQWSVSVKVEK